VAVLKCCTIILLFLLLIIYICISYFFVFHDILGKWGEVVGLTRKMDRLESQALMYCGRDTQNSLELKSWSNKLLLSKMFINVQAAFPVSKRC
jgi:hypothetical protein